MAENPRIDDLRKRYHENPRRFFAPLANEYRKAGFLDRALLLCEKHLAEQPENMNGLIVFGQTLFESGATEEARAPFEQALALDPENLIALRHLGDIGRLGGDDAAARAWYMKVLELDRRNDEVQELLEQVGGAPEPAAAPTQKASPVGRAPLVSVAPSVSVSESDGFELGMVDLESPSAPPVSAAPPASGGKGSTVVIDAQALADADAREAQASSAVTKPVAAVRPPTPARPTAAVAPPTKRASLLDIDFDFGDVPLEEAKPPVPETPVSGTERAEYGFVDVDVDVDADALDAGEVDSLMVEQSAAGEPMAPAPVVPESSLPAGDLELAEFSAEVSPLAGLEATEFEAIEAPPLEGLTEDPSVPSAVAPLEGLDRVDVHVEDVAPLSGLDGLEPTAAAEPVLELPSVELPSVELPSVELPSVDVAFAEPPSFDDLPPLEEFPSAPRPGGPRPRMTRADLASLPLLADFGLDDDSEPEPPDAKLPTPASPAAAVPAPTEASRRSQATPTFVTETMAALYLEQGFRTEAIGVYRQLIAQSPDDEGLRARLAALEGGDERLPEFEAPPEGAREPDPAPANAVLADVSFAHVALRGAGGTTPPMATPAVPAGPTAREFFAAFVRRGATVVAPAATADVPVVGQGAEPSPPEETAPTIPASVWPLDALFGAANDVRDLHAAETLAGIATFVGPSGGSGLDQLLQGPTPRRSVPRVSQSITFDQFFESPVVALPDESSADDDDLDQFHGWLQGLKP